MEWREQPLDARFQRCLPGADPTGMTFEPFKVALGNQEQGMYAGLVSPRPREIALPGCTNVPYSTRV